MLASIPASILNQSRPDLGIPNRFRLKSSRFNENAIDLYNRVQIGAPVVVFPPGLGV
jgi:hypothetical protein